MELETSLFAAYLESDESALERVEVLLETSASELTHEDRAAYRARLLDQRAYRAGHAGELQRALELYAAIDDDPLLPFVAFRRAAGLAYCRWKLGDRLEGIRLARLAATHAGDGGLIRFRAMALSLLAQMIEDGAEAAQLAARAERMAQAIEDEELSGRMRRG